ncbi:hypothetical protein CPB84DRAFT_1751428 [Gymnopilus junonius]|uniref:Uncharacterized protein n=1 Tax=Gymnopilus junonius TaxID=109634 RepID=A0A9P5NE92_GYMJU|nr:hypothetical protein CPB84DRAFT_1751428 [Gymnopilus junonius]
MKATSHNIGYHVDYEGSNTTPQQRICQAILLDAMVEKQKTYQSKEYTISKLQIRITSSVPKMQPQETIEGETIKDEIYSRVLECKVQHYGVDYILFSLRPENISKVAKALEKEELWPVQLRHQHLQGPRDRFTLRGFNDVDNGHSDSSLWVTKGVEWQIIVPFEVLIEPSQYWFHIKSSISMNLSASKAGIVANIRLHCSRTTARGKQNASRTASVNTSVPLAVSSLWPFRKK